MKYEKLKDNKNGVIHGKSKTSIYYIWRDIKSRCSNSKFKNYKNYGGRGIKVCKRWENFENFFEDMGERPKEMFLDRINTNKNYCKSNCRWVTLKVKSNNKSNNKFLTFKNKKQTVSQWADEVGLYPVTLRSRLKKGWSVKRALTTPLLR